MLNIAGSTGEGFQYALIGIIWVEVSGYLDPFTAMLGTIAVPISGFMGLQVKEEVTSERETTQNYGTQQKLSDTKSTLGRKGVFKLCSPTIYKTTHERKIFHSFQSSGKL